MNLTLIADAGLADEPLSLADCESYLVLDQGTQPENLSRMISAARLEAENEQGRELAKKQWQLVLDQFPTSAAWTDLGFWPQINQRQVTIYTADDCIQLLDPLISVDSFTYKKSDGTVTTMVSGTDYIVDTLKHPGIVCPPYGSQWPTATLWPTSPVQITFTAGMLPLQVPATIKNSMLLLIAQWFEDRIPFSAVRFVAELPFSVTSGFRNGKLWKF